MEASRLTFFGLFALQHRGQESAGISSSDGQALYTRKGMGLVSQVFIEDTLAYLRGHMAIGHTRYSTTGASKIYNAQPIACLSEHGDVAVAHNGNLINTEELRQDLLSRGIELEGTNDSELMARILSLELARFEPVEAVRRTMRRLRGAYSCVVLLKDRVLGFRDPHGIRPLVAGTVGDGYMLASETCAFGPIGGKVVQEIEPGQIVSLSADGIAVEQGVPREGEALCMFEFIYFARPDSHMYGTSLYLSRERMGEELAREHPVDADLVVPVPDSGIPAALGYAREASIPFREGMMKSRYIHRTFIQPDQRMREMGVRMKLSPIAEHIAGQRIVLVDDSIVRATTTNKIVRLMREAGAKEVHVRITAPPICNPCFYGIDMAKREELAAARWSVEEIRGHLGADSLGYLSLEGCLRAVGQPRDRFCLACFNGEYPLKP